LTFVVGHLPVAAVAVAGFGFGFGVLGAVVFEGAAHVVAFLDAAFGVATDVAGVAFGLDQFAPAGCSLGG